MPDGTAQGRESVAAKPDENKKAKALDPGLRRDDELELRRDDESGMLRWDDESGQAFAEQTKVSAG
jgi:hypothetical protein